MTQRHDPDFAEAVGARIRQARKALQLTQEQAAERCKLHTNFYSRIERGVNTPSLVKFAGICRALGADAHWLLGGCPNRSCGHSADEHDEEDRCVHDDYTANECPCGQSAVIDARARDAIDGRGWEMSAEERAVRGFPVVGRFGLRGES